VLTNKLQVIRAAALQLEHASKADLVRQAMDKFYTRIACKLHAIGKHLASIQKQPLMQSRVSQHHISSKAKNPWD